MYNNTTTQMMIADKDLATITNRLQVPVIIADILNNQCALSDDVTLALHEILSEDQPDSALLSIALSALSLANRYKTETISFHMLRAESERIIAEYGMLWLRNAQEKSMDDNVVFETLVHIPEDFECLAELLMFAKMALHRQGHDAGVVLCDILTAQANAHKLIAETYLECVEGSIEQCSSDLSNSAFNEASGNETSGDIIPWDFSDHCPIDENAYDQDFETESDIEAMIADNAVHAKTNNVIQFPIIYR